jgi:hypothetical protein
MKKFTMLMMAVMVMVALCMTGCMKPPITEKYKDVENNETAFVVQLEGSAQAKLNSLAALEKLQVSTKRINISQRYKKVGRMWWMHVVVPTVKVIVVDRTPVTREWSAGDGGTNAQKNESIWVESMDSIGFSTGFNCTAEVYEADAALFLYKYPGGSLARVMDDQIRNDIQAVASEVAAAYPMDDCRSKKLEIIKIVREKIIPKYALTGITVSTIGMFGGFTYEDKEIQVAINKTFVAQQAKVTALAEYEAQEDKNRTIEKAALGLKQASITKAEGEATSVTLRATAEAAAIESVSLAAEKANSNPVFVTLKQISVEEQRIAQWDGKYPLWMTGGGGDGMNLMVQPPSTR